MGMLKSDQDVSVFSPKNEIFNGGKNLGANGNNKSILGGLRIGDRENTNIDAGGDLNMSRMSQNRGLRGKQGTVSVDPSILMGGARLGGRDTLNNSISRKDTLNFPKKDNLNDPSGNTSFQQNFKTIQLKTSDGENDTMNNSKANLGGNPNLNLMGQRSKSIRDKILQIEEPQL